MVMPRSDDSNTLDDDIARHLEASRRSGELAGAPSYGRPMAADAGYDATPESLRLPFKILKNAGFVPPEVELMQRLAALRQEAAAAPAGSAAQRALQQRVAEQEQLLALRLERLRISQTL